MFHSSREKSPEMQGPMGVGGRQFGSQRRSQKPDDVDVYRAFSIVRKRALG